MSNIGVFIVDDNFIARRGLRSVLESESGITIVGEASTGSEAVRHVHEGGADVILMDIRMSGIDGIRATAEIMKNYPNAKVLVLTVIEDPVVLANAMLAGASGYLVYGHFAPESLTDAIRAVANGEVVNVPCIPAPLNIKRREPTEQGKLTQREEEVLRLIAVGRENREIARSLQIEEKTVKNHINNIYSKLNVRNRQEAIYYVLNLLSNKTRLS